MTRVLPRPLVWALVLLSLWMGGCMAASPTLPTLLPSPTPRLSTLVVTPTVPRAAGPAGQGVNLRTPSATIPKSTQPQPSRRVTASPSPERSTPTSSPATLTAAPETPTPLPTPTVLPSPTATLDLEPPFAGRCAPGVTAPCLYSVGWMVYKGKPMYRYVFENIRHPDQLYVEINGVRLECLYLPQYSRTRAYCVGVVPAQKPVLLRLGYIRDRVFYQIPVPLELQPELDEAIPLGAPAISRPQPTPKPSDNTNTNTGGYP
ncbi:MAG: hypothetical protein GXO36_03705 [Chloroflexi bacterium]|nr:hypothetical protein [Chloroflexota bacterium]